MLCLVAQWCLTLCDPTNCKPARLLGPWGFSRQEYWNRLPCPPPGDLPNPGVLHCRWFFTDLATREAQEYWRWVAYPFSRGSSQPRNGTGVSCIAGEFFTSWATRAYKFPWTRFQELRPCKPHQSQLMPSFIPDSYVSVPQIVPPLPLAISISGSLDLYWQWFDPLGLSG